MKMKDLALAQVRRGERFTLDGVEFVKLEDDMDAAFAVAADTLPECCQFEDDDAEREDHNNYAGSLLSKTVERWLRDKHPAIFSAVVERPIDLTTMDGMTDYGKPLAVARALTIDEYRKHRSVLPLTSKPYWLATGWTTIGGTRYYMNQDGAMVEGWSQQNGTWYYLKPGSGNIATGWLKLGATWYYLASDGKMLTGFQNIGGSKYYLNTGSGAMVVGWLQLGSDWYYMNGSGAMLTGWQKIGSTWYYLNPTTGKMATGWTIVGGSKYYMNGSGAMLTDWQNIDGSEYYFYSSGAMAVSTVIGGVEIGADGKASRTESQAMGTLTKFLKTMIQPVGNTLYVWGGGHDAWTDGDGLRIGMNPKWKQFYNQQGASYNYTKHRYEYQNGLDCSGLVSWAVYNTYNTKSNQKETAYSSTSTGFPAYLTNKGFGSHGKVSGGTFTPGDVVSMTGHVWVVLGMCSDGSLVIVHATPPVVQISGTVNTAGSTNSEAVKLAKAYMKKYYSDAAGKYNLCIASKAYVNNVDRFHWSSSSMRDPDGLRNMTAAQVLEKLIGPQ